MPGILFSSLTLVWRRIREPLAPHQARTNLNYTRRLAHYAGVGCIQWARVQDLHNPTALAMTALELNDGVVFRCELGVFNNNGNTNASQGVEHALHLIVQLIDVRFLCCLSWIAEAHRPFHVATITRQQLVELIWHRVVDGTEIAIRFQLSLSIHQMHCMYRILCRLKLRQLASKQTQHDDMLVQGDGLIAL